MKIIKLYSLKVLNKLNPKSKERAYVVFRFIYHNLTSIKRIIITKKYLNRIKRENKEKYDMSRKALWRFTFRAPSTKLLLDFLKTYSNANIQKIKEMKITEIQEEPVLVCAVKNDLSRIKKHYQFHKSIGIKNFVYIDNMSDDGTYEWLLEQDVNLYQTNDIYNSTVRNAWFRLINDIYGYDRWYLFLDSDEFFVYPNHEKNKIDKLIDYMNLSGKRILKNFMVDMYPNNTVKFFKNNLNGNIEDSIDNYKYFDVDSYKLTSKITGPAIKGGPRSRVFSEDGSQFDTLLTKNPLVYMKKEYFYTTHFMVPYYLNYNAPLFSILLHYKFLQSDLQKIYQAVKDKNYAGGSSQYITYLNKIKKNEFKLSFHNEKSQKFENSLSIRKINIIDHQIFEDVESIKF